MHDYSLNEAIGYSVFYSLSSFNNAGIDITTSTNLISYSNDYYFFVTALLFTLGGIGYFVIIDTVKKFNFKKFSLHVRIFLTYTVTLIISGSLLLYLAELGNSISDTNYLNALFISASSSTPGFTTANLANLREASIILLCVFMFIGASPGGTGGGIKTTTFAIFLAYFRGVITNKSPRLFKRRIKDQLIRKTLLIIIVS